MKYRIGCNKAAFGHDADDAATTLLSLMFQGHLGSVAPRQEFCEGSIDVIRSLIHVPEQSLIRYGRAAGFGSPPECPQAQISQREQVKRFLKLFGHSRGQVRTNIWRAARREMDFKAIPGTVAAFSLTNLEPSM